METLVSNRKIEKNGVDVFITDEYDLFKFKPGKFVKGFQQPSCPVSMTIRSVS